MTMTPIIKKNGDVRWHTQDGRTVGFGFTNDNKTTALIRCPECGRENYVLNVASGQCTWCPFNANKHVS